MKNIITVIAIVVSSLAYSQRVFIIPNKENDTITFKIQNDEMYRLLIIQDSVTKFQKDFKGIKYFKIYSKGSLYSKQVDTNNKIVALFFTNMDKFSKRELRRFARQEEYYQVRDLIQDYLDEFQDRDINDFQDDRDSIIDNRDNERQ